MNQTFSLANDELFQLAFDFIENTSQHLFITGKAGTGKTTFLKHLRSNSKKQMIVAAPTGVAAINAGGVTLHSLFQLSFEPFIPNKPLKKSFMFGKAKRDLLQRMEVLIIDEVSMLRADTLDAIDSTLRFIRRNQNPFGGVQTVYIGDMFQLPPVVKEDEWNIVKEFYPTAFFFHAKVIEKANPLYIEFKKVHRQHNQYFIELLNRVRNNVLSDADISALNERCVPNCLNRNDDRFITLTTHNYQSDIINKKNLETLPDKEFVFTGEITGDFPAYSLPTELNLVLKKGAQVMFIKNDETSPPRYFNGKIAEITTITDDEIGVLPENASEIVKVKKEKWNNVRYTLDQETKAVQDEVVGSFLQYPLRLAWAITIHKSQGLTFEKIAIDIERAFAAGQAYVALSRCTSLEGILLTSPLSSHCVQTNKYAIELQKNEKKTDDLQQLLIQAKQQFEEEQLLRFFDWNNLLNLLHTFKKNTENKVSDSIIEVHQLADMLYQKAKAQQKITDRFKQQLHNLVLQAKKNNDLSLLQERCCKAVSYFYENIRIEIINPLQTHKSKFHKNKKAKSYLELLNELETDVISFADQLTKTSYRNVLFIKEIPFIQMCPSEQNHPLVGNSNQQESSGKRNSHTSGSKHGTKGNHKKKASKK
jgi:hypothetical protein